MSTMNFIHIPANDKLPITLREASQEEAFDKMRELVGYIAVVTLPEDNSFAPKHQLYVDEEATFKRPLVNNTRATIILMDSVSYVTPIIGDVVLVTRPDITENEDGDEDIVFPLLSDEVKSKVLSFNA